MAKKSEKKPYYREILAEKSAIWGDLYAATMTQALHTHDKHDTIATFHAYIRKNPFGGSHLVTAGQNIIREWLEKHWRFDERDMQVLRNKKVLDPKTGQMKPMFTEDCLYMFENAEFECDVKMMPEGEIAFADQPIVSVTGPLWQGLLIEGPILNCLSQSLFATLASRLMEATKTTGIVLFSQKEAKDEFGTIIELGLRRSQAIGGLEPSRGSYVGGVTATSNMLAEKYYDIPTVGTMAHALVMTYEDELQAFSDYTQAMPYNGVFLVDTYDTVQGVKNAIKACKKYGTALKGVRLDSGDLAKLSKEARILLDEAGFKEAKIVASNDLDEDSIKELIAKGAKIDIWGVGTNLVTSKAQPSLGAVYKLGAIYDDSLTPEMIDAIRETVLQNPNRKLPDNFMRDVIKLSEQIEKSSLPGELDVLRILFNDKSFSHDLIVTSETAQHSIHNGRLNRSVFAGSKNAEGLHETVQGNYAYRVLEPVFKRGKFIGKPETIHEARARVFAQKEKLAPSYKKLDNPDVYPVYIEQDILNRRKELMKKRSVKQKVA